MNTDSMDISSQPIYMEEEEEEEEVLGMTVIRFTTLTRQLLTQVNENVFPDRPTLERLILATEEIMNFMELYPRLADTCDIELCHTRKNISATCAFHLIENQIISFLKSRKYGRMKNDGRDYEGICRWVSKCIE